MTCHAKRGRLLRIDSLTHQWASVTYRIVHVPNGSYLLHLTHCFNTFWCFYTLKCLFRERMTSSTDLPTGLSSSKIANLWYSSQNLETGTSNLVTEICPALFCDESSAYMECYHLLCDFLLGYFSMRSEHLALTWWPKWETLKMKPREFVVLF